MYVCICMYNVLNEYNTYLNYRLRSLEKAKAKDMQDFELKVKKTRCKFCRFSRCNNLFFTRNTQGIQQGASCINEDKKIGRNKRPNSRT